MNERIVCAAIKTHIGADIIILGIRHYDPFMNSQLNGRIRGSAFIQGFITNKGRFLDRKEAWEVAKREGQIIRRVGGDDGVLCSENLY